MLTPNKLIIEYTPNSQNWCSNKRPCYRKAKCKYCWNRFRKFIIRQAQHFFHEWDLTNHYIIVFEQSNDPTEALYWLNGLKAQFMRSLARNAKYLCVTSLSVQEEQDSDGCYYPATCPHFHMVISTKLSESLLAQIVQKCIPDIRFDSKIIHISTLQGFINVVGYLLDQNLRISLKYQPPKLRLITASRGWRTGKPRNLQIQSYAFTGEF